MGRELELLKGFVIAAAMMYGFFYNMLVAWLEKKRLADGETSLLVAVGSAVTIAFAIPFIGLEDALIVAGMFCLTGVPMIVGSKVRHHRDRAAALALLAELRNVKAESERIRVETEDRPGTGC
jgi:uncharacterized protein involved in response to NO